MAEILCSNAMELALENKVAMMVVVTENGQIARMLARQRPQATILACSVQSNLQQYLNYLKILKVLTFCFLLMQQIYGVLTMIIQLMIVAR